MHKRRRLTQPTLPTSPAEADNIIRQSRFDKLGDSQFYRGLVESEDNASAVVFCSNQQLELIQSATSVYFDATFKVVPAIYYQLFTIFVPFADSAFPVFYALMTRKTRSIYIAVFEKLKELAPSFKPTSAMADFEEASVSALQHVFGAVHVSGCWFHYAQAIVKRLNKVGLKEAYSRNSDVKDTTLCLLGLPLLPASAMNQAIDELMQSLNQSSLYIAKLKELINYVCKQWIRKQSIGPERLTVRDNNSRTNNVLESYHASLRRRIQVSHPNLFGFLGHLQRITTDNMNDKIRLTNGHKIKRAKKKINIMNESRIKACIARYDGGAYDRLQFLRAISHCLGAHTETFNHLLQTSSDLENENDDASTSVTPISTVPSAASTVPNVPTTSVDAVATGVVETCEVCLNAPRSGVALVPCGHARFCSECADTVFSMGAGCPICRTHINLVMRLY
jgi:hypothetical protein